MTTATGATTQVTTMLGLITWYLLDKGINWLFSINATLVLSMKLVEQAMQDREDLSYFNLLALLSLSSCF